MPIIPFYPKTTESEIEKLGPVEKNRTIVIKIEDKDRDYMGLSQIGYECNRYAQFVFRFAFTWVIPRRTRRIFDTGHIAEEFIIEDLRRIGITVTGQQDEIVGFAEHWKGHIDGRAIGVIEAPKTEHLLEMKTMAQKYFVALVNKGIEASNPKYYDQCQSYMGYTKLTRTLFVAYNKNTSEYKIIRIPFNKERFADLKRKELIIVEDRLMSGIGNPRIHYKCRMCNARDLCVGVVEPDVNCRTCQYSDAENGGVWSCSFHKKTLTLVDQRNGCNKYVKDEFFNILHTKVVPTRSN